jgi:hypothetical protein
MKIALPLVLAGVAASVLFGAHAATTVPSRPFDALELRGGGHVTLKHGPTQIVRILNGSTQYTNIHADPEQSRKLVIDTCNSSCPHQYNLDIEIVTPDMPAVAISGGGAIESAGGFPSQHSVTAAVHGGGRIDLRSIDAADATAAVDGGGSIAVKAVDGLTAAVNGGGKIRYWGNPRVTEAVNGGGSVSRGD